MKSIALALVVTLGLYGSDVFAEGVPKVEKKIARMIELNQPEYLKLKRSIGIVDTELTRTDVLELIALSNAKTMDGMNERMEALDRRVRQLELDSRQLRTDADKLRQDTDNMQKTVDGIDADVTKLFDWSKKVDDSIFTGLASDGVLSKINQLRADVAADLKAHGNAINNNSNSIDQNARAIREVANALRSIR